MSDTNLIFKRVAVTEHTISASGIEITPGAEVGKTVLRATGSFRLASSAVGGTPSANFVLPSGIAFEHESSAALIVSAPKAARLQVIRYS